MQKAKEKQRFKTGHYAGNKWGGKFLRAPDIFYTILRKGKGKLVRLGDIAEVRRGFTTGANDFFYLPSKYFDLKEEGEYYRLIPKQEGLPDDIKIEKEFLKPVIKSPRECKSIVINPDDLKHKVFMCHKSKSELRGTSALKYIEWGEKKRFDNAPTVKGRKYWWSLFEPKFSDYLWTMTYRDRFFVLVNGRALADARFYDIYSKIRNMEILGLILNSTFTLFYIELMSRTYGGGGGPVDVKVYEVEWLIIPNPNYFEKLIKFDNILRRSLNSIFTELGFDPSKPIREQEPNPLPDRAELDKIIFDELGLTEEERKEVYWAVAELVKQRLDKARSLEK
ncbi:MAG: hypothetical protein ACTSU7_11245 [Candidatus Heimdallarchaeaceae archaeon]